MQLGGAPSPLAVVGLGKIGEFEINGECFGNAMGLIDGETSDNFPRLVEQGIFEIRRRSLRSVAAPDAE